MPWACCELGLGLRLPSSPGALSMSNVAVLPEFVRDVVLLVLALAANRCRAHTSDNCSRCDCTCRASLASPNAPRTRSNCASRRAAPWRMSQSDCALTKVEEAGMAFAHWRISHMQPHVGNDSSSVSGCNPTASRVLVDIGGPIALCVLSQLWCVCAGVRGRLATASLLLGPSLAYMHRFAAQL